MDQTAFRRWWPLHLRAARGEHLTAEERVLYEAGLAEMEGAESFDRAREAVRQLRAAVGSLEAEHAALAGRRRQLEAEIARLEASLGKDARQLLGAGD